MYVSVSDTIRSIEDIGNQSFTRYTTECLVERTEPLDTPIKRHKIAMFSSKIPKRTNQKSQIKKMRNDCDLFSKLYITCQTRNIDLDDFLMHENQEYPPSLAKYGVLRNGEKSELLNCMEDIVPWGKDRPVVAEIIDGACSVHLLEPTTAKTVEDYATDVFLPYIQG
ncbi:unnamed protein product [Owenia fusiformis]|uniref:Uncharacterized protein n=1 Tax=Owenia fusiformis TaxID=6347 RepID=A0A8J1UY89_OWEFU|nr:unnamed protein product [Owenia fusiformis]